MTDPQHSFLTEAQAERAVRRVLKREMPAALKDLEGMLADFNESAYLLKEWITPEEASRYVGGYWKPSTVRRYVQEEKLPGAVHGNCTMVHRPSLEEHWHHHSRGGVAGKNAPEAGETAEKSDL